MHTIVGMPLQHIIMGMPIPIMVVMRVQHSCIISMVMPGMGAMVQTMPSLVISQVMVQVITGIIIGIMPPIMGMVPIGMVPIPIIGMAAAGICIAVIMILSPLGVSPGLASSDGGSVAPTPHPLNRRQRPLCAFIR
jgi:hypothetical protein